MSRAVIKFDGNSNQQNAPTNTITATTVTATSRRSIHFEIFTFSDAQLTYKYTNTPLHSMESRILVLSRTNTFTRTHVQCTNRMYFRASVTNDNIIIMENAFAQKAKS